MIPCCLSSKHIHKSSEYFNGAKSTEENIFVIQKKNGEGREKKNKQMKHNSKTSK